MQICGVFWLIFFKKIVVQSCLKKKEIAICLHMKTTRGSKNSTSVHPSVVNEIKERRLDRAGHYRA